MNLNPARFFRRALGIKASPLRWGDNGPYVFIHINKTAGTSVGRAIGLPIKDHLSARDVIAKIGKEQWNSAFTFTVVRNPWDKVVSHYEYRRKKDRTKIATLGIGFAEWVALTYGEPKDPRFYNNPLAFQPQVEWLKDDEGKVLIDFAARFESLAEDFKTIAEKIGIDAELPHLNATRRAGFREYYDDESRAVIAHWFREDIEAFGYTFDGGEALPPS